MNQPEILFALQGALQRNPGAEVITTLTPFLVARQGRRNHVKASLVLADGSVLKTAIGPTKDCALRNLNTRLELT